MPRGFKVLTLALPCILNKRANLGKEARSRQMVREVSFGFQRAAYFIDRRKPS